MQRRAHLPCPPARGPGFFFWSLGLGTTPQEFFSNLEKQYSQTGLGLPEQLLTRVFNMVVRCVRSREAGRLPRIYARTRARRRARGRLLLAEILVDREKRQQAGGPTDTRAAAAAAAALRRYEQCFNDDQGTQGALPER